MLTYAKILKSIIVFKYLFLYSFKGGVNQSETTSRSFMRVKSREPVKNPNFCKFLLITSKNADVSKTSVTSYGFFGVEFFSRGVGPCPCQRI